MCEINRNTFYYYYSDIYQVLEELLRTETEKSLKEKQENHSFYEDCLKKYHLILEYKKAVYHLYNSKNRDLILKYLYDITENYMEKYVLKEVEGKKLSAEDIQFIAKQLLQFKIDGLIVTNTTLSREGVENLPHGDEAGGLSGAPVFEKSTACLAAFSAALKGEIPLIGVGGILSGEQAVAKKNAGASLVQVYSGLIYAGPELVQDCVNAL